MKKIFAAIFCAALVLTLASCGQIIEGITSSGIIEDAVGVVQDAADAVKNFGGDANTCGFCGQQKACTPTVYLGKEFYVCDGCAAFVDGAVNVADEALGAVENAIAGLENFGGNENTCGICGQQKACEPTMYLGEDFYACEDCAAIINNAANAIEDAVENAVGGN